jgi:glycerophosphoryl diester phosphodiesterase
VWLERRVIAYAHQGGAWESPSSTLHALAHAVGAGVTGIELDVHATADGELVVCHDATVDRTTPAHGTIASFTLAQLRALDFSYWWIPGADVTPDRPAGEYPFRGRAPEDPSFGIATLREVLEQFPGVVLNLDIKQTAPVVPPYEESLARLLAEFGRSDDVIVASFLDPATDAFRRFAPSVPTSAGTVATAEAWRAVQAGDELPDIPAVAYQVPERQGDLVVVDERFVQAAHRAGKAVHVWTVNDTESMERLLGLGVDGIISDLPTTLCGVLASRGVAWAGVGAGAGPGTGAGESERP